MIGERHFEFSKEQAGKVYQALDCNQWNMVKAFSIAWEDPDIFGKNDRSHAEFVLGLIEKLIAYRVVVGRSFERIWTEWFKDGHTYERVRVIKPSLIPNVLCQSQ